MTKAKIADVFVRFTAEENTFLVFASAADYWFKCSRQPSSSHWRFRFFVSVMWSLLIKKNKEEGEGSRQYLGRLRVTIIRVETINNKSKQGTVISNHHPKNIPTPWPCSCRGNACERRRFQHLEHNSIKVKSLKLRR
jgi:hypothetical protein